MFRPWLLLWTLALSTLGLGQLRADPVVNPPLPITHRVQVQMVQVCDTDGSCATMLGNSTQRAAIEDKVDLIWAQSGVVIDFLPGVTTWTNATAYDGATALGQITGPGPKHPDNRVLNLYFVAKSPCHSILGGNSAAGCAWIDSNGIAMYVGSNLLTWNGGRDVVAEVLAHEIGHNLGLSHINSSDNLMASGNSNSSRLTASQTNTVFTNNAGLDGYDLLELYSPPTNYELWSEANGISGELAGDDDGDGMSNLLEFALGLTGNPDAAAMPKPTNDGTDQFLWTVNRNPAAVADGVILSFEGSYDLQNWFVLDGTHSNPSITYSLTGDQMTLASNAPGPVFFRIQVSIPASSGATQASGAPAVKVRLCESCGEPALGGLCEHCMPASK